MYTKKKKILVVNPESLFPTVMMSQLRALNQIFSLAKYHEVDVATFVKNDEMRKLSEEGLAGKVNKFVGIKAINYDGKIFAKYFYNIKFLLLNRIFGIRVAVSNFSSKYSVNSLVRIINKKKYDIVISHYWWGSFFFNKKFNCDPIKIIDLHAMVDEDIILNRNETYYKKNHQLEKKINKKNLKYQKEIFHNIDKVIPNSHVQVEILKENYPSLDYYYCPNGQFIENYIRFRKNMYEEKTILFYGTLNSLQNRRAFELFYKNVWPLILSKEENAKLLIVGNNPPTEIKALTQNPNISVTGYVEDVRDYIIKASCMVLPMDIGIGFRGRVIEVMGLGVPVVGNHNALDCIGLKHGVNGFISDDYNAMAEYTLKLIKDTSFRAKISEEAIKFIDENYSISKTFDKFSKDIALF